MSSKVSYALNQKSSQAQRPPKNWPCHLRYLFSSVYHSSVSFEALSNIKGMTPSSKAGNSSDTLRRPKTAIRIITIDSHPAKGQFGLFAAQKIAPKTHIVDYIGIIYMQYA